jgi:DNA-binding protein H-NS
MARTAIAQSGPKLDSMSIDELTALREQVQQELNAKVVDQRRTLEAELSKLNRFQGGTTRMKSANGHGVRSPVEPKYRNPENPHETWAGRGLKPRWLTAAIQSGKALDDFLISRSTPPSKPVERKKLGKARK